MSKGERKTVKRRVWQAAAVGLLALLTVLPARAEPAGYAGGYLTLVEEPGDTSEYVDFYRDGEVTAAEEMHWMPDGIHGQALLLDGRSEYFRVDYWQLQMPELSLAAWVNWKGSADGSESGLFGQRLFTMYRNEENFWTVSLRLKQEITEKDGTSYAVDGLYMEYRLGGEDGVRLIGANPVSRGENYAVPIGEWHHYAVTLGSQRLRLYVDGVLWYEQELQLGAADMQANALLFGSGIGDEPTLYAAVDDAALFTEALSAEQVSLLARRAELSFSDPAEPTTAYLPTAPPTTVTTAATAASPAKQSAWQTVTALHAGLPLWTWILLAAYLLLFVGATVAVNVRAGRHRKEEKRDERG